MPDIDPAPQPPTEPVASPVPEAPATSEATPELQAANVEPRAAADAGAVTTMAEAPDGAQAAAATPPLPKLPELSPAACGARLAELFPALFGPDGPPKPLKLKIQADIQQRAPGVFSRRTLGIFFSRYTTGNAYIKALLSAPHRYDLDGQPAGAISAEHKAAATEELARRRAIVDERRAAEREARRAEDKAAFKARQVSERAAQKTQVVEDQARRDRAFVLRAFETSSLTKANFCALKGVTEAELDAQLDQARKERAERPPMPPRPPFAPPPEGRPDRGARPGGPGGTGGHRGRPPRGTPRPAR